MTGKNTIIFGAFGLLLIVLSCKKQPAAVAWAPFSLDGDYALTSLVMEGENRWHAVGGKTWFSGIYLSGTPSQSNIQPDSITPKRLNSICQDPQGNLFAVGFTGFFCSKAVNDTVWSVKKLFDNFDILRDVDFGQDSVGLAVAGVAFHTGFILEINKAGEVLHIDTLENELRAVTLLQDKTAIAAGYGVILRRDKNHHWQQLPYSGDFFVDVTFPTPFTGYIIGNAGSILKTTDGGATWQFLRKPSAYSDKTAFRAVCFPDALTGFIAGDNGLLWKTTDGGNSWKVADNLPDVNFFDVKVAGKTGILAGDDATIIRFDASF